MTNIFPGMFEDHYLKVFSESIQALSDAKAEVEIERAVKVGFSALENVANISVREKAKQKLRMMEEMARDRIAKS